MQQKEREVLFPVDEVTGKEKFSPEVLKLIDLFAISESNRTGLDEDDHVKKRLYGSSLEKKLRRFEALDTNNPNILQ